MFFDAIMNVFGKNIVGKPLSTSGLDKQNVKLKEFEGANILLVEDNEINQEVASELLISMGLNVEVAGNGKIATEIVLSSQPDRFNLIFIDLQMPVMDGVTATKIILGNSAYSKIPIVAMTADVLDGVKEKCMEVGMKGFVSKPINPVEVAKAIINLAVKPDKSEQTNQNIDGNSSYKHLLDFDKIVGISTNEGLQRVNNNRKLYESILLKFVNNYNDFLQEVIAGTNDKVLISSKLHTLKGVCGNIGATELYQQIVNVEDSFRDGIPNNAKELLSSLEGNLNVVISSIANAKLKAEEIHHSGTFEMDEETIGSINKIILLLSDSDAEGIILFEELNLQESHAELDGKIKQALSEYDFDEAIELLTELLNNKK